MLMLHSRPTLVFKPLIPRRPILYLLPLPPHHRPLLLAVLLCLLSPLPHDSLRVLQWNAGGLRAGALNCFTFFRPILLTLSVSKNPILTHLPLSGFLDSLLCVVIAPKSRSGILSRDATHVSGDAIIFVRQGLSFSELSTSSLSSLDPYSDYIVLTTPPRCHFLMCMPSICSSSRDGRADSFSPSIFPSSKNLFILGDFNCHYSLWDSRGTSEPHREDVFDWVISSNLLPLKDLTHPPFSTAPSLTSLLLPLLLLVLAPGRCFRTWVLTTYQFFYLSLSLWSLTPTSVLLLSIFRKLVGMTLSTTLTFTVHLQRNTCLFLFPLLLLFLPLWH